MAATINFLEKIDNDSGSPLFQRIDFNQLGAMGHSFGAMIPFELINKNNRFRAGINLDGWLGNRKENAQTILKTPFLFIVNDSSYPTAEFKRENLDDLQQICINAQTICEIKILPGSAHETFTDYAFLRWPFNRSSKSYGNPYAIVQNLNEQIVSFFSKYL